MLCIELISTINPQNYIFFLIYANIYVFFCKKNHRLYPLTSRLITSSPHNLITSNPYPITYTLSPFALLKFLKVFHLSPNLPFVYPYATFGLGISKLWG